MDLKKTLMTLVIFLFLLSSAFGAEKDRDMFLYKDIEVLLTIDNRITVDTFSQDSYIDFVSANLSWFPRNDYRQRIETFTTTPKAEKKQNLEFLWERPSDNVFDLKLEAKLISKNEFVPVGKKVPFPVRNIGYEYKEYLQAGQIADLNTDIARLASELSEGEDDMYVVVFTLADWVKENIEYNLTSVTADAAMKSSWVLENKQGVCDELTSLFMSLCRSLGIPTKFVSGMSYTDLELFSSPWGPHGWSEVYFPDIGWVPFDVTYRQMGYLDATHIKLREAPDAKDSSIEYLSRGRDIKIKGGPLNINVETLKKGVKVVPNIDINVFVKYEDVGFGSYNLVWAEIKNLHEYYVTADLALSRTNELKVVYGKHKTSLLLRPLEKKKVYWIVQVDENLKQGWSYKFPVELRDIRGAESLAHFNSLRTDPIYSYIEIKNLIPRSATKPEKRTEFECIAPESRYNIDAEITITCTIKNLQTARKQYNICLDTNCKDELIQGGEEKTIQFARRLTKPGINNIVVSAEHGTEQKRSYLLLDVLVEPKINVTDLEYPKTIEFKDEGKIIFTIRKNQDSVAKNIKVTLVHDKVHMQKNFQEILQPQEFSILFYGSNLKGKNNDFEIVIDYEDDQGKKFQTVEKFTIEIVNLTFFQKFMLFIDDLENKVFH